LEIAHSLYSLGIKRVTLGQYEPAVAVLKESLQIHQKHFGLSGALHISVLAWAKMFMGRYQAAYQQAETALKMMQAADDQRGSGWTYHVLGGICLGLGALERAQHFLAASLQAYGPLDQRMELAFALAMLGYARCLRNQFGGAQRDLVEVLRISQEIHAVPSLIYGIVGMALLLARQHQVERAVEIYALGSTFPCVANSRWFADVVGQHVDTAAAALPPDVVVKAEKRGRARDLWATAAELRTIFG
jgi:tetratricopeptide (TPR) repeat protein